MTTVNTDTILGALTEALQQLVTSEEERQAVRIAVKATNEILMSQGTAFGDGTFLQLFLELFKILWPIILEIIRGGGEK